MKKLLLALALLFLPATAQAGVSCSVPFNLTNGTTADATQVMANYNAILACLSTSTAHSGANTDITSLGGLTTPITPAQGGATGLCGVTGLTMVNDGGLPNTEIDIAYNQATVVSSLGVLQSSTVSGSLTLNFGTAGAANALDTGALAASTVYNIFLIGNGSAIASLASLSATAPLLPSGYTLSCRVGAWYSNTASHLVTGKIGGNKFMLLQKPGGAGSNIVAGALQFTTVSTGSCGNVPANDTTVLTAFVGIPPTALEAIGTIYATGYSAVSNVGPSTPSANEVASNGTAQTTIQFDLIMPAAQSLYLCTTVNAGPLTSITGWVDSVNAH